MTGAPPTPARFPSLRLLLWVGLGTVALRSLLAAWIPLSGDEAYYAAWGLHPQAGYYDQPPMIGWLLALFGRLGVHAFWLRVPALLAGPLGAWAAYRLARPLGAERGRLAALYFLLCPFDLLLVVITNDAALLIFAALALVCFQRHLEQGRWRDALLAGLWVGCAFASKYFGALLGAGFVLVLLQRRERRALAAAALIFAAALPFLLQHLWFNAGECWSTVRFNTLVRTAELQLDPRTIASYLGTVVYAATPWLPVLLWRGRRELEQETLRRTLLLLAVPLAFFAAVGLRHLIGVHWALPFMPLVAALAALLDAPRAKIAVAATAAFGALHAAAVAALLLAPPPLMRSRFYQDTFVTSNFPALCAALARHPDLPAFAFGYSPASTIGWQCQRHVGVLFSQSIYGRQYDKWDDLAALAGRDLLLVSPRPLDPAPYRSYFESLQVEPLTVAGAPMALAVARRLDYARYRERVLVEIHRRFYQIPDAWPQRGCFFTERYGFLPADGASAPAQR